MMKEPASQSEKAGAVTSAAQTAGGGPPCAAKVEKTLSLPSNALLSKVEVSIVAMPAGECSLDEAGEIRLGEEKKKVIIDLKRMRSVRGLQAPQDIQQINAWTGAEFGGSNISAGKNHLFSEIATERLLVTFTDDADIEELAAKGTINLPDAPADLVLSINGKTAWTHIGPVKLSRADNETSDGAAILDAKAKDALVTALVNLLQDIQSGKHSAKDFFKLLEEYGITISAAEHSTFKVLLNNMSRPAAAKTKEALLNWLVAQGVLWEGQNTSSAAAFRESIDITQVLQDEINAGVSPLKIVLRAALSCRLQLTIPSPEYLLSYDVVFPAQAQALEITEECRSTLTLPLPATSNSWLTSSVFFTLAGKVGRSRFFPAVGPKPLSLGELLLNSDHALAASLSWDILKKFKTIDGVRLPLQVEKGGAEITAFLRQDNGGKVGAILADAVFQSHTIDQAPVEQWVFLKLSKPVDIQTGTDLWLEINVIRGKCWWQLGDSSDSSDGIVLLQRGIPGGAFSYFTLTLNKQTQES